MKPNLERIQRELIVLSKQVGNFIRLEATKFDSSRIEEKGLNDLVSYVDKEAEGRLVEGLKLIFPKAGFITEEGTETITSEDYNWIVDPLDGTTNFMHGLPVYSVSVALSYKDKIVVGVVYEVNRDECFYAVEGGKAYMNEKEIKVSDASSMANSLLATGFPYYTFEKMPQYLEILNHLMQKSHGLRRMGSAAVDLAYTACGRFEGYFEYNLKPWDVAAGTLIVQQAGGKVTDFSGGENYIFGGEIVASNGIHPELLDVIKGVWEK
jgi:myo-inositol-1(or 4)-monophosphatase